MIDVLVVGAGVAGSAVAAHLARRGRRVVLVDRATFPRRKACGEGLFPAGVRELRDLGALDQLTETAPLERLRFEGYGITAEASLGSHNAPALGIRRDLLDAALLACAREAGADLRCGRRVRGLNSAEDGRYGVMVDGVSIEARVIVAADGLNSGLRQQAGLTAAPRGDRFGVTVHAELPEPPEERVEVHFRRGFEVYVTPVGETLVNVAVLMRRPLTKQLARGAGSFLERVLQEEGCLPGGWRLVDEPLVAGPFPVKPRRLWSRNLVLAGDAAGFFDGITGEGMSLALVSARHCAEAVDGFLDTGSTRPFDEYAGRRRALARNSELLGRLTLALASREWTARRALQALAKRPETFSKLVAVSSGERGLSSLRPWDFPGSVPWRGGL